MALQEDLKQYSVNSNIINTTKNEEKILGLIPNLLVKDNLECIDLLDIEENNNIELISSILNDNNNILSNISNNTNFVNFSSDNTLRISEPTSPVQPTIAIFII